MTRSRLSPRFVTPPDAESIRRRTALARSRGDMFVAAFAAGCALSSVYGFLSGAWPFGAVEAIWSLIALRRYRAAVAR